ncbi:MAG TPA: sensor histidine kinase N-terminal domain-containing protein [Amaricoccus sp.]|uniref:sensor histidine kinase n=1 Tax=Amaricoccus sp. TaxID=1872485 RepID=UPI002BDDBF00|nr:sensor histidine kinase N-terminal domain-containing protein [Amaricoccus sp.]HRO12799.1 sensor histidine kinase N-terminal domain-containing protein [Amaricoccus sp.]
MGSGSTPATAGGTRGEAPRSASLTLRLALSVALVILGGGTLVALAAFAYGRQAAQQAYDRLLIGAADQIAGSVSIRGGAVSVDIPASAFQLLSLAPDDRVLYAVFDPAGRLVTGYPGVAIPAARFANADFAGEPVRLTRVGRPFSERDFAGEVDVVVGQTTRARDALAREITRSALLVVGLLGLLMAGLAAFAIRSALAPLRRVEAGLAVRDSRDLTPLDVAVPREIGQLVATINRFMARQARQFDIMRNLIADASHQLRTPVAAMRAQAELAAEEPDPERQRAVIARIHDRAVGLSRLTDQLLNHALIIHRADAAPHETLDLRTIAIGIVEEIDAPELYLDLPEDPVACRGDALSLREAGKNLVNNALRHGAPPVTIEVRGEVRGDGGRAVLAVRDRGPGMPEALWQGAAARFDRTGAVTPQSASIGLSIVAAVAAAHHGELRFARTPSGAFEAALLLPAGGAS